MSACDWTDFDATSAEIEAQVAKDVPQDEPMSFHWFSRSPTELRRMAEVYAGMVEMWLRESARPIR